MKKHYETHVEDTDKLISVAGPELDYKSWYEQYRKLMEEQAQRKYGLYTPTSEGDDDDFPSIPGMIARYSASGLTNEQMKENPVWVDKTGNGHDLQMKNFIWGEMSGVGGYKLNWGDSSIWRNYIVQGAFGTGEVTDNTIHITSAKTNNALFETGASLKSVEYKVLIKGLTDDIYLRYGVFNDGKELWTEIKNDGIYTLPSYDYDSRYNMKWKVMSQTYPIDCNITIEQLPLYPGALVFDGVDDYGVCDNFPILTKEKGYTVVALRQWDQDFLNTTLTGGLLSTRNYSTGEGVAFEKIESSNKGYWNLGAGGIIDFAKSPFTWQTSKQYNNVGILKGDKNHGKPLCVGCGLSGGQQCGRFAIWELVFLDHDATEEELTKIKDYFVKTYPWLFPDQAWTVVGKTNEDEDRATIANITGNGNDLILSNFGFVEGSGYGLYKTPFELYPSVQHSSKYNLSFSKFALGDHNLIIAPKQNDLSYDIKVKVTGLKEGVKFKWGWIGTTGYIDITTDGIHMLNKPASQIRQLIVEFAEDFDPDHVVTIEQIPEYEGYLVTDGVDDKVVSKQFKFGENFTVILDFKFPVKKISYCGFDLSTKVRIQNFQGSGVYVVLKGNKTLIPSNVVRAVTSEGKVYDENWNEYNIVPGNVLSNYTMVNLGFDGSNQFAESATKLAGIYSSTLSKDDCIKAYNYLQTLKAK